MCVGLVNEVIESIIYELIMIMMMMTVIIVVMIMIFFFYSFYLFINSFIVHLKEGIVEVLDCGGSHE